MPEINNAPLPQQPQYIYVQQPRFYNGQEDVTEIDLLELIAAVWKRKRFIFFVTFIFAVCSLAYSLYLPFIYRAECRFLPPNAGSGSSGRLASFAAQFGGLASTFGANMTTSSGGMMLGILQGDTVVDAIINKFNLMEELKQEYRINARKAVLKNLEAQEDPKSFILSVAYLDEDPQKAADIANAFVEELRKMLLDVSVADAQESRFFYENQLKQALEELTQAENEMIQYQQSSGVIVPDAQARTLLGTIASLRARIASKNIEITSLRAYAREDNPRLKVALTELEAMERELAQLEEEQRRVNTTVNSGRTGTDFSTGQMPELGIEYQRYARTLAFANTKYNTMLRQYENAKLIEASDLSTIHVLDPATPPDYKYKPSRARICIMGTFMGGFLASCWAAFPNLKKQMFAGRRKKDYDDDDDDDD